MLKVDLNNPMEIRMAGIQALKDALGPVVEKAIEKTFPLFLAGLMSGIGQTKAHIPAPSAVTTALSDNQNSDEDVDWDFLGE